MGECVNTLPGEYSSQHAVSFVNKPTVYCLKGEEELF